MKEILSNLAEKIVSKAREKGLDDLEFYGRWSRSLEVKISRNRIKEISSNETVEYGVLGAIGKKLGSIGSQDLNMDPGQLIDRLVSVIKASQEDPSWKGFAKNYGRGVSGKGFDDKIVNMGPDQVIDTLNNIIDTVRDTAIKHGAEEVLISEGGYEVVVGGVLIGNINGEEQYGEYTLNAAFYEVKSRKGGEESSYYGFTYDRKYDLEEALNDAKRAGEYSIKFIGAKPVEAGEYTVMLDPYMTGLFLQVALEPAFSALNIQENRSPLKNKIGSQILSENIDILDDPTIDWGLGTRPFDDEGIATTKKLLVEKGVLKTYLYNYYTAMRENRSSTGNGVRRSVSSPTTPSSLNFVVSVRGSLMSEDELIREIKKGLIVHGMIGYWMSNPVNGSTQATVSHGLLVENGEIKRPVKGVVIGGNIYEWLGKNMVGVGREVRKVYNIYTPAILVEKVRVAG